MNNGKSNVLHLTPPAPTSIPGPGVTAADRRVEIANARRPSAVRSGLGGSILAAAAIALGVVLALATYAAAQPAQPDAAVAVFDAAPSSPDAPTPAEVGSGVGTTVDAPDPATDPVGFGGKVLAMYRAGQLLPAIILLLFGVAVFLHKKLGWFSKGRAALYAAAAIAGLTMLAEAASRGTTPNAGQFIAAAAMVIGMVLNTVLGKSKG